MKHIPLLAFLLCLGGVGAVAATLSGSVTVMNSGTPVVNHIVYVSDSLNLWRDSALTNSSGIYTFNVPGSIVTGNRLLVQTMGCTSTLSQRVYPNGSNLTASFFGCNPQIPTGDTLRGTVSLAGPSGNNGQARIYVILKTFDSVNSSWMLHPIDSFLTAASGGSFVRVYASSFFGGQLLLKAALLPGHPTYASYLPTYFGNSTSWSGATAVGMVSFNTSTYNISMVAGTNPGGPGFIGGSVILGANKTSGTGDPLSGRILILANSANKPVAYAYSDATGHFEFRNIALGAYKIYGDAGGKTNPALTLTLTSSAQRITNVIFDENSTSFVGRFGSLGMQVPAALAALKVFPNPATTHVQIDGLAAIKGEKTITLQTVTGAVVSTHIVFGGTASIATDALPAGTYLLRVVTESGTASFRILK